MTFISLAAGLPLLAAAAIFVIPLFNDRSPVLQPIPVRRRPTTPRR